MGILNSLKKAHKRIPGVEEFHLLPHGGTPVVVDGREFSQTKGGGKADKVQVETDQKTFRIYTTQVPAIGDRLRRVSDQVLYEIVFGVTSWRGNRGEVLCKRVRGRVE